MNTSGDYYSLGAGRRVIANNILILAIPIFVAAYLGCLRFEDAALLSFYFGAPFAFDAGLFIQSLPLIGRILPRATIILELGGWATSIGVGISLSVVYAIYRGIGAAAMAIPYYKSKKR